MKYTQRGSGIPLVFLHGMGGSHRQILDTLDVIPGVRLIVPDLQAHGGSEVSWSGYGFDALAQDVAALADFLELGPFFLGGISMGAAVSVKAALGHPSRVRGLLLVRPAWINRAMRAEVRHIYALCASYLERGDREGFEHTPDYLALKARSAYTSGALSAYFNDPASISHAKKFLILPACAPYSKPDLKAITGIRTSIIACRNDLVHPFEYAEFHREHIAGASLHEIPDKDRDSPAHRAQLNRHIRGFLQSEAGK